MNINSRLKGAVDRELGEIYTVFVSPIFGKLNFDECCRNTNFLVRFLRIRPVQSVVNSLTQLSGRGFPRIFHMKLVLSQHHVFVCTPKWKPGRVIWKLTNLNVVNLTHWNFSSNKIVCVWCDAKKDEKMKLRILRFINVGYLNFVFYNKIETNMNMFFWTLELNMLVVFEFL